MDDIKELKEAFALIAHLLEDYSNGPECSAKDTLLQADEGFDICEKHE